MIERLRKTLKIIQIATVCKSSRAWYTVINDYKLFIVVNHVRYRCINLWETGLKCCSDTFVQNDLKLTAKRF